MPSTSLSYISSQDGTGTERYCSGNPCTIHKFDRKFSTELYMEQTQLIMCQIKATTFSTIIQIGNKLEEQMQDHLLITAELKQPEQNFKLGLCKLQSFKGLVCLLSLVQQ